MDKIQEIVERVPIEEILRRYWGAPNRAGRYKCVFHNGKDNNMVALDKRCYCFVCNESGNAINVVRTIFNCSTPKAIEMIDDDFRLGLAKPLSAEERRKYAELQKAREVAKQKQENLEKFESECIEGILAKLRIADEYLLNTKFNGIVNSAEMYHYGDSLQFVMHEKAKDRVRWLEWLWCLLTGDTHYLVEEDFCATYGTDKVEILRKIYKKEILI
jgi:hypothetical protein